MSEAGLASTPKRRWRFGLRAGLAGVTLVCAALAWVAYHLNWIRQRTRAITTGAVVVTHPHAMFKSPDDALPPIALRLLGERGYDELFYIPVWAHEGDLSAFTALAKSAIPTRRLTENEIRELKALFPESQLRPFGAGER